MLLRLSVIRALLPWLLAAPLVLPALLGMAAALGAAWPPGSADGAQALWPSQRVQGLLLQGLALALLAGLLATLLAAVCAMALLLPLRRAWRLAGVALLAASFCYGTVVHMLGWRTLFPGVSGGAAGWALASLTLALRYAPLSVALLASGLAAMERAELETALGVGGGRALWTVARRRLLRLGGMSVAAVAALVFAESELPPLLGVHVYAEEFLSQVALEPDSRRAAAQGWPLMLVAVVGALLLARLPRLRPSAAGAVSLGWLGQWHFAPRAWRHALALPALTVAGAPLLLLLLGSLLSPGRWPAQAGAALANSLWVAAAAAAVSCAWAWCLATVAPARGGAWLQGLLWLAMLWPAALTGLALAGVAWAADFPLLQLLLGHALRVAPFAAWVMLALRDAQPTGPLEQLRSLGARGLATWRHVLWPAHRAAWVAAFMLALGLSLAELTITVLTVPPGMETVILRLYNLLHYGDQRGVMMLALLQGLAVAGGSLLALLLLGRARAGN